MLWGLKPVEQKAAHGLAVDRLKRLVHLGLLLPGERMPSERKLAEQIAISRVTLREALSVLEGEGYVSIRRGATGGAFVADEDALRHMAENHYSADPAAAMRVFEYRAIAEPMAARLAAVRRTPADLKQIDAAISALGAANSLGEIRRSEALFHLSVAQASANRFVTDSVEDALTSLFLPLPRGDVSAIRDDSLSARAAVADAIKARAEALADTAMTAAVALDRTRLPARRVA